MYRTGSADPVPDTSTHKVFVRTPKGDKALDYSNPEVLRWLRQTEVPQRQSVESLIGKGASKAVGSSSAVPQSLIKTGIKESADISDFDMVLH